MKTLHDIPKLSGERIDGHATEFRRDRGDFFVRMQRERGDLARLRFFHLSIAGISSPELVREVLVEKAKSYEKSLALRMAFYPLAGWGIFTSEGELWKRQRKLMAPLFHPSVVRGWDATINATIAGYLDAWKDGEIIDVGREMTRITMAVAGKVLFDADTGSEADAIGEAIQVMFHHLAEQGGNPWLIARATLGVNLVKLGELPPWGERLRTRALERIAMPVRWPTPARRKLYAAVDTLDQQIQRMIDERRQDRTERSDVLARLLAARDEDDGAVMSDRQVRDEAVTLFVAGHETTATGTTWALHFLSRHPEVYRRWKDEVAAIGDRLPTADDAPRLGYTLGIFKEALRFYPPVFMIDRVNVEETTLGGYHLPWGTPVFICPYSLHRNPALWPDPERFDPERFTPEAESARHRMAWLPFGAGPRVCIGAQLANLEAQLLFAQIAQRFDLEAVSAEPVPPSFQSALRPAVPVRLRVRRRRGGVQVGAAIEA